MENNSKENLKKERNGWITLVFFMLLFPVLFFLCVYFPIWTGIAGPY